MTTMPEAIALLVDELEPIFDAAEGLRVQMERRGFSPTAAEQVAVVFTVHVLTRAIGGSSCAG